MIVILHIVIAEQENTFITWAEPLEGFCADVCHCKTSHPSLEGTEHLVENGLIWNIIVVHQRASSFLRE